MQYKITVKGNNQEFIVDEGRQFSIGRVGGGASFEVEDSSGSLSRGHMQVFVQDGNIQIIDTNSTNGVYVNGQKLRPAEPYLLNLGDSFKAGSVEMQMQQISSSSNVGTAKKKSSATLRSNRGVDFSHNAQSGLFLSMMSQSRPIRIGRGEGNDFKIDPNDLTVSRNHAQLIYENGQWYLIDLNSRNGVFVNSKRVFGKTPISVDDQIFICLHAFSLSKGYADLRQEVAIQAEGIEKKFPNGYVGLKQLNLNIAYGRFVAVMGPSGCGKSTLLKVLNADNPASSGSVKIHGLDLVENFSLLKKKIGYVPQDDIIHRELTVEQTMYFCAKLRMPKETPMQMAQEKIMSVLLSLFDEEKTKAIYYKTVSSLSGGERKRLSIAVELLTDPTILFLDEPTSPLDPESIHEFLTKLNNLKSRGTTIIMVTHKPEDLNYVDDVCFLGSGGVHVFFGDSDDIMSYFKKESIVQVYGLLSNKQVANDFYKKRYSGAEGQENFKKGQTHPTAVQRDSFFHQLSWLSRRYFQIKFNDKGNLLLLLAQPVIIGALISIIFSEFQLGAMFLMAIASIWFGVSNAAKEIVGEQSIFKRERMFNLWINAYVLSKIAVLSLISMAQLLVFEAIIYFRFSLFPVDGFEDVLQQNFFGAFAFMTFLAISSTLLGLMLSAIFDSTEKVMTVVPIALMPQIMLAGVITRIDNYGMEILSFLTFGRWGTEGLARIQDGSVYDGDLTEVPKDIESVIAYVPTLKTDSIIKPDGSVIINNMMDPNETEVSTRSALSLLDFYNEELVDNGDLIGDFFNSMSANLVAMLALNITFYTFIYVFLKKKDSV
ncbi:MAG: hypothetical protein DA405_07665 [Bacteroidetes bacterium]|nr:MAG: hypothetical protein DA405_07665 [Bacteroidota bacterium]